MRRTIGLLVALLCIGGISFLNSLSFDTLDVEKKYTYESKPEGGPDHYPPFWVTEDYWVTESCDVSQSVKTEAEKILAPLDADNIAKTVIVCMPAEGFTNPGIWADRFGTHYEIGLKDGPRKNNGIIWLVLENTNQTYSVHYAIGDGLAFITAGELGPIQRQAESKTSLTDVITDISREFDSLARANYEPFNPTDPAFGGPIEGVDPATERLALVVGKFLILLALGFEALLGAVVFLTASQSAWVMLGWPLYLLSAIAESSIESGGSGGFGGGSFGGSSRGSSKSTGGGGSFHRSK